MKLTVSAALLAALAVAAPVPAPDPVLDFSGPPGSAKPALTTTPSGGLLATWFEPRDSGRFALRLAARNAGRWSTPVTVAESERFFVNWADFPGAVETSGGRWIVYWLEKTAAKSYAYHIRVSSSGDRGKSWSAPATAHSDRSDTEHGFVAMLPRPGGSGGGGADLVWLDGRQNADSARAGMALAAGSIDAEGRTQPDALIDALVCDCCQTALARTSDGLIAAYRNRTPEEVRDIHVIRQLNGRWTSPARVAEDGWVYRACPVNGPSLAAQGKTVVIAWYTGANNTPRVKLAWSADAGASFAAPVQVDDGSPLGRSEVELAADGSALAIWLEKTGAAAEWRLKRIGPDGKTLARWTIGTVPPTRDAGFTRAARLGGDLYIAWSDRSEQGGVRIHRLEGVAR